MDSRKLVLRETGIVLLGEAICTGLMFGVYALIGRLGSNVIFGGLLGLALATGNFFFMAITASNAADRAANLGEVRSGVVNMRLSFLLRMAVIFGILVFCVKFGGLDPIASVLPLAFVRIVITLAEFF